ncbi:MBL fold metallo-hydrolase [Salinibacillus xinjiangensis]|uniref:MBL fold metallo-hydrolase n=1 Tax=Salinibacillus xinjiangensis TaxID=1229268 RepID=A0A6G1X6A0_9BACI|nr:MBL fold metallo-hydrolase [Salinibacillus xinjiangensis]
MKTENVFQLTVPTPYPVGDVHMYVLKGDTLSLIDAGVNTAEAWEGIKDQLKAIGYQVTDIEQLILTHHHPDHIGLVDRFDHVENIYGHQLVQPWLTHDQAYFNRYQQFFEQLYEDCGVPDQFRALLKSLIVEKYLSGKSSLTDFLKEGDALPGHEDWQVLETPGHAQSHLSFYHSGHHSLLAGDHVLAHISSNPLLEPPSQEGESRPKPLLQYRDSMTKLLNYEIDQVYPGHGELFHRVNHLIRDRIKKQEARAEKVYRFLAEGPLTAYETCQRLFPKQYKTQFGLTMSETIGQLDYLESVGKVTVEQVKDYYVYRPNK